MNIVFDEDVVITREARGAMARRGVLPPELLFDLRLMVTFDGVQDDPACAFVALTLANLVLLNLTPGLVGHDSELDGG